MIEIYNAATSPFVTQYNALEFAIAAYKPSMTTLEARRLLLALNKIHMTFFEHEQRKINQRRGKNGH